MFPDPSLSPSGDTSRVFTVRSGVPGLFPEPEPFPDCVPPALSVLVFPAPACCPVPNLSTSAENRTRCEASVDSRDIEGREVFSTAEVLAAGVASIGLCGASIVYGALVVSIALRVSGDNSSSSRGAECRRRMPPLGGSPDPDMFATHLIHGGESTATIDLQPSRPGMLWAASVVLAACRDFCAS